NCAVAGPAQVRTARLLSRVRHRCFVQVVIDRILTGLGAQAVGSRVSYPNRNGADNYLNAPARRCNDSAPGARNDKSSYRDHPHSLIIQRLLMEVTGATEERVRILLTNDDGVYAPGLQALRTELLKLGEVLVVAPASEQSGVGHSITLLTPLLVQE